MAHWLAFPLGIAVMFPTYGFSRTKPLPSCPGRSAAYYGAINDRDLDRLAKLFSTASTRCRLGKDGRTPLMWAALRDEVAVMTWFLARGAQVDDADKHGGTALTYAASNGAAAAIALLLKRGAAIDHRSKRGRTALSVALKNKRCRAVEALMARGAKTTRARQVARFVGGCAMLNAVKAEAPKRHAALIDQGGDLRWRDRHGETLLHHAAELGHVRTLGVLLDRGAAIEARGGALNYTPLIRAADRNQLATTKLLLDRGAKVDALYVKGGWPADRGTALIVAANKGYLKLLQLLLRRGADTNIRGHGGSTALYYAAREGHRAVVEALLRAGANPRLRGADKRTPAQIAKKKRRAAIVAMFKSWKRQRRKRPKP